MNVRIVPPQHCTIFSVFRLVLRLAASRLGGQIAQIFEYFLRSGPQQGFYPAEEYHKEYYAKHPNVGHSEAVIKHKVERVKEKYPDLLK